MINTNSKTKIACFHSFANLIQDQFMQGEDKYALGKDKEMTDWVCEISPGETGADWILGAIAKYIIRFKNFKNEKDLLKIATFAYIMWLKQGFHLKAQYEESAKIISSPAGVGGIESKKMVDGLGNRDRQESSGHNLSAGTGKDSGYMPKKHNTTVAGTM